MNDQLYYYGKLSSVNVIAINLNVYEACCCIAVVFYFTLGSTRLILALIQSP